MGGPIRHRTETPVLAMAIAALIAGLASPRAALGQAPAPDTDTSRTEILLVTQSDTPRDFRAWAVFGLTTATGIVSLSLGYAVVLLSTGDAPNDFGFNLANGIALAVAPGTGAALSHLVTRRSRAYASSIGAMMLGGYLGAGLAFMGSYLFLRSDDPTADGQYEPGYFDPSTHNWRAVGSVLFCYLLPIFAPAVGASLGYIWGRTPKKPKPWVSLAPPTPILFERRGPNGKSKPIPGLSLIRMTF